MSNNLSPWPRVRFTDANGNPLSGGKLYTYRTGTSSPKASYSDSAGTPNANPVILDAEGYADVWLADDEPYRFRLENSAGVLQWQRDNMAGAAGANVRNVETIADLKLISGNSTSKTTVSVAGYYAAGDNGGGMFWWNDASTATDDGGMVIKATATAVGRWIRICDSSDVWVEWFGAQGGSASDQTSIINKAINYVNSVGGGIVRFGQGTFLCSITMKNYVSLVGAGCSQYEFDLSKLGATELKRYGTTARVIDARNCSYINIRDMDINGDENGSGSAYDGISGEGSNFTTIERAKLINCRRGYDGGATTPAGDVKIVNSYVRGNSIGVYNVRDSFFSGNSFSGNTSIGIYFNTGQNRIENNLLEFHMGPDAGTGVIRNPADAIYLDQNANEIIIANNHFDRNAGYDVRINSNVKIPNKILITGNMFKRSAWGNGITTGLRVSILCGNSGDNITMVGNTFERGNQSPSTIEGYWSPVRAAYFNTATAIVQEGNNFVELGALSLNKTNFTWTLSASGTNEYYLKDTSNYQSNPYVPQPDSVKNNRTTMNAGSVGALAAGEWAWADNDSLGFSTVYVRLASGNIPSTTTADTVYCNWNYPIINLTSTTDYKTEVARDQYKFFVNAGATVENTFKTREYITSITDVMPMCLEISGDETTTGADAYFLFPFLMFRATSSTAITIKNGNIQTYEAGFTAGWTAAGTTLEVTVTASPMGDEIYVSTKNTGANRLDLNIRVKW